jgi:opacity protein-like surface antigen
MARTLWIPLVTLSLLATAPARAETANDAVRLRDDQIAELMRKVDVLTDEVATLRTQVAVPEEAELKSAYGLGPSASKIYGVQRGISLGGYGEANYINSLGQEDGDTPDRADALRTVLYLGYKFSDRILFNSEIEFEHATTEAANNGGEAGSVSVEFAALDFLWRPEVNARAGLLLVPMGFLNEVHEPPYFLGVMRPAVERRILPSTWRENGVGVFGTLGESLEYRAYALNGFNAQNFSDSGVRDGRQNGNLALAEDFAFVTRLDWTPEPLPGFLLGGAFYVGDSGQDVELDGNELPDARLWIFEGHAQYEDGPFHARGLFAYSSLSDAGELTDVLLADDPDFDGPVADEMLGGYAELAYDVYPWLFGDEAHQLEPFVRGEYVDTQYDVPSGFEANRDKAYWVYTGGANFYPHPNVVLKLEYRNINPRGSADPADELGLGIGFAF